MTRTINSINEITLDWLIETLSEVKEFQEDKIIELNVKQIGEGIGQLGEFALLETKRESGEETNIFAKVQTANEDLDNVAKDYQFYLREVRFYKNLAHKINVKTPRPYYVEHNAETEKVVLLLEYMDGWYNPDQIKGASKQEIDVAIEGLIPISTQFWGTIKEIDWVPDMKEDYMLKLVDDMVEYQPEFLKRFGYLMNDSRRGNLSKIVDYYPKFPEIFSNGLLTLAHWDYRVENLFFTPEVDDLTVIDWQLMMAHKPGWDLAYLLCTNIQVDLRREIYDESCKKYLEGINSKGIEFTEDQLEEYMMLSLLAMTSFPVIGGSNYDLDNQRSQKLFEALAERIFSAIEDYDAMRFIS